ncbi:unnamed protein product, partial [Oppiella nova]
MTPLILEWVDTMNDNIDKIIAKSNGKLSALVDVKQITGAYVMESIIQVAFGRKVSALIEPNNPIIENARKLFNTSLLTMVKFLIILMTPNVAKVLRVSTFNREVMDFFRDFTLILIGDRKHVLETGSPVKRVDFLQFLLDSIKNNNNKAIDGSEKYTDTQSAEKYQEIQATDDMTDKSHTNDELMSQCVLFLMAGYESTANTLSMCLYNIAKHPDKSGDDSYEAFYALKYMDAVIDETLRLFPAAIFIERIPSENYELKGTGITIKKDHSVHIPIYAMHRDPANFVDPDP